MRTRYKIIDTDRIYFITATIIEWLPVFTRKPYFEVLIDSFNYSRTNKGLKIYAYVIMDNHFHLICQGDDLGKIIKEIKSYTNVKLIPPYLDNHQIIKNSQLVITVTGTPGWEALLFHNKPVINLCEDFYEITGLSKRIHNIADLSKEIQSEIKRISEISTEERKRRIVCLLNAIIINSSWADKPLRVLGEEEAPVSEQEVMDAGTLLGNEIGKYLDRLQN